jgi:hypothetical protein
MDGEYALRPASGATLKALARTRLRMSHPKAIMTAQEMVLARTVEPEFGYVTGGWEVQCARGGSAPSRAVACTFERRC